MKTEIDHQSVKVVVALVGVGIFVAVPVRAQAQTAKQNESPVIQVGTSYHNDVSPPLRDTAGPWPAPEDTEKRATGLSPMIRGHHLDTSGIVNQNAFWHPFVTSSIPSPILNFDGMQSGFGPPPGMDGAVGLTQYVQTVNGAYEVFDKATGASVLGPATISSLFAGFGGVCQNSGSGEPVVLYDNLANRWLISQFAGSGGISTDACLAISTTSDATGTYHRYGFHLGSNFFDQPRLGLWPDGYYMSVIVFNSSGTAFLGPQAFAFERTKMLAGLPPTALTLGITGGPSEPSFEPSDLDGATTPPAGTGNPFVSFPGNGTYKVRLFHADFVTPGNSTFNLIGSPAVAGFTVLCPSTLACVPQLGTTTALDGLGRGLMVRLAYRNFSDHESLVGNYAVSANGVAGIRWFELRNVTSGPVTVYQEATYQPDATWRWNGSAAMDQAGNLALGFSASSDTVFPSIRYTGRLVSDPVNTLPQGEATLIAGGGSQTGSSAWGPHSSMTVDPVDDCTFWYTNEYYATTSPGSWRTRIGNFRFKECTTGPTPTPTATATATATPVATATPTPTSTATVTPSVTPIPTPSPTVTPSPSPAQALNLSTRLRVETGDGVMIGGFIITGNEPKKVAIRGLGPSLGLSGLSDVLADPTLELRGSDGALLMQDDDWQDDSAQATQLTDLGLALQDPKESGIVATLNPGAYTAIVAGRDQTTGIGLVEVYDADTAAASQLANISTRGFVQTGNNVMIGGFILGNASGNAAVAVRGIGPSLSRSGLSNALADPTLEVRDSNGAVLIANDNWQEDAFAAAQLNAVGLAPADPLESAIFATLPPGLFTAILAGKSGGVGAGLLEVYCNLPVPAITVTSTADSGAGSLRQALADANDGDTIQFDVALNGQTITLTSAELVIDKSIMIAGPGPGVLAVSRDQQAPAFGIVQVMPGHTVIIDGLKISGGSIGGGIVNGGSLTIHNCVVRNNFNEGNGGGILNSGSLTLTESYVYGNQAGFSMDVPTGYGGGISSYGAATIRDSTVSDNVAGSKFTPGPGPGYGGGIANSGTLEISNSTISNNDGRFWGGGISNDGTVTITDSTVSDNVAGSKFTSGTGFGGGISNQDGGMLTMRNGTVSGNRTRNHSSGGGGGIFSGSGAAPLEISNSTISGNFTFLEGGGILNSGSLTITNSTFAYNSALPPFGGDIDNDGGMLQIGNTILQAGVNGSSISSHNSGVVISNGYNLSSDSGGGLLTVIGDQINTDPLLGPLQNNGGPTSTYELMPGSPAVNAGDPNFTPPPFHDQRGPGFDRVYNGRIDIGSSEVQPCCPPTPSPIPGR